MAQGPYLTLSVDLHELDRFFPLEFNLEGHLEYDLNIDRKRYEEVSVLLKEFEISERQVIQEFCFIVLWIEGETRINDGQEEPFGKYHRMSAELDDLKQFLMSHRITEISLIGEYEKNKPFGEMTLADPMNIDRICDGLRSVFRKEFHEKKECKTKAGQIAWKKKKMGQVKNAILKYLDSVPKLTSLSLESGYYIIGKLAALTGYYKSEKDYTAGLKEKLPDPYRTYLVQSVKMLK